MIHMPIVKLDMVLLAEGVEFKHIAALSFDAWQFRSVNCDVSAR